MRRIWTTLLALPLVFASCSETPAADTKPAAGTIEVSIGSGPKIGIRTGAQTRTELDEEGKSVRWADNDRIVLWAVNSQAQTTIDRQVFKLWHYNAEYNTAKFTATVPEMPEDTYVYYAVSPEPVSAEGLKASYRIPAEQDGTFSGDCDIMVAALVEGTALQQGDNSEMVKLEFDHKVHVLKISIPSNDLGEEISKITLTFPEPVTGTLTVDAADPAAAPQLTDGSNILTLNFDTPKKPGDTVYAVIAPVELTSEQEVTITATGTTRESRPKTFPGKHFAEGHTTPISYSIPPVGPTTLRVSLPDTGKSTLGENITSFTLTAAEGVDLSGGGVQRAHLPGGDGRQFRLCVRRISRSPRGSVRRRQLRIGKRPAQRRFVRHPGTDGRRHDYHRNLERALSDGRGFLEPDRGFLSGNVNERPLRFGTSRMDSRQPLARMERDLHCHP